MSVTIIDTLKVLWRWGSGEAVGADTLEAVVANPHIGGSGPVVALFWTGAAGKFGSPLGDQAALFRTALLASVV
mgnify:CR=1 FL=1